ncbi:MAG: hypothetical protein JJLCMIEE_00926 [Acidimicrobiales bacterium]|nr:MAG: hypothetical protein EDR02_11130 [Actinomycetota bacterium]MBV6507868.1 hypothetical protein [Acidimicrobiales bacterium]RIK06014.1 MAG: hypothetical protein DCC48_08670 [Acidobacteriota bacterium]
MLPSNASPPNSPTEPAALPGEQVEIRCSFDGSWTSGFEIAEVLATDGSGHKLQIKRVSDGEILPSLFPPDVVRGRRFPSG